MLPIGHHGRAGRSSERAALIYRHSTKERQKEVAAGLMLVFGLGGTGLPR